MTKSRAVTPRPPASSLATRVAIELEIDSSLAPMVIAAGARLGVEVRVRKGLRGCQGIVTGGNKNVVLIFSLAV